MMSPTTENRLREVREFLGSQLVFRLTQLIAVFSLVIALIVGIQQIRLNQCVVEWMDQNTDITLARTQAAEADRRALDNLISAISTAERGDSVREALATYLRIRAEADQKRAENPLPEAPSVVC